MQALRATLALSANPSWRAWANKAVETPNDVRVRARASDARIQRLQYMISSGTDAASALGPPTILRMNSGAWDELHGADMAAWLAAQGSFLGKPKQPTAAARKLPKPAPEKPSGMRAKLGSGAGAAKPAMDDGFDTMMAKLPKWRRGDIKGVQVRHRSSPHAQRLHQQHRLTLLLAPFPPWQERVTFLAELLGTNESRVHALAACRVGWSTCSPSRRTRWPPTWTA